MWPSHFIRRDAYKSGATCSSGAEPQHWVGETDSRTARVPRRTTQRRRRMLLLLSLGLLQGLLALNPSSSHSHLDEVESILDEAGRSSYSSLLQLVKEGGPDFEQLALEMPIAQDDLVSEASSVMEPQMLLTALQAQGREERSPRRCVRLQESCLGHKLPCCDPCATCYCRFFNANCFCKKFSNTFPCGRN